MLIFLRDIDKRFANQQFQLYKKYFLDTRLGLPGIREYKAGDYGTGDVDSGPVVLQMGASATIVGMGTLAVYGDDNGSASIRNVIESFGFPVARHDQKIYLFGVLPMADCFIAWSHSMCNPTTTTKMSFIPFHIISAIFGCILGILMFYIWRPSRPSSIKSLHVPW